jgi:5-methylcytosine-specific restriction endonuclease McrA
MNTTKNIKFNDETIIEFIESAILKSLPKEISSQEKLKQINRRRSINDTTRYAVLERAGFKCQCCGIRPLKDNDVILHIDHIIPYSLGGGDNIDNLQVLCDKCNTSKQNRFIVNHNINWIEEA